MVIGGTRMLSWKYLRNIPNEVTDLKKAKEMSSRNIKAVTPILEGDKSAIVI